MPSHRQFFKFFRKTIDLIGKTIVDIMLMGCVEKNCKRITHRQCENISYLFGYLIGGGIFFDDTLFVRAGRVFSGLSMGLGSMAGLILIGGFTSFCVFVSNIFLYVLTTSGGGSSPFVCFGCCCCCCC